MDKDKRISEYMIALVSEFSKRYHLTDTQAFRYLKRFGAVKFFIQNYEAAHTQSFEDMVEAAKDYCKQRGGAIA